MKKTIKVIAIGVVLMLAILTLTACGTTKTSVNETKVEQNEEQNKEVTIDTFVDKMKASGLTVGTRTQKAANIIGAIEGYSIEIDGGIIEIYKFDTKNNSELAETAIKSAKEKNTIQILNAYEVDATYNKGLMLVSYQQNKSKDKILEIFNTL